MTTASITQAVTLPAQILPGGCRAWSRAPSRTLVVALGAGPAARGGRAADLPLVWPDHPAGAVLDYTLELVRETPDPPRILAVATTVDLPGLTVEAAIIDASRVTLWLTGGTAGDLVTIALTLTLADGQTDLRAVQLNIA